MADKRKKKVAFLGIKGLPSKFGADRVVEGIVNNLAADFEIYVYCSHSVSRDYHPEHINLIKIRHPGGKHLFTFSLSLLSALHALLFKTFDVVNVHNTDSGFIVPILRLRYRVIGTSHGFAYKRMKWGGFAKRFFIWSEKIMLSESAVVTCVSKSITVELVDRYSKDVLFIPNGIDRPDPVEDPALFDSYGLEDKDFICFAAGRVDPTKGCHLLLEAFQGIDRDIRVVAIGDFGHKKDYTEQLYGMADDRVTFVPFISKKEVLFGIVNRAKLFVFPSTVEAMSIMLLEVAALGVPAVCSDIPENKTVLEDRTTYFRSGDSKDLREKIISCLDSYDDALNRAQATKSWVLETYNWKRIAAQYKKLYNDVAL